MTDNTQVELDDLFMHLIDQIATRRVTDKDMAETKQAIIDWHNKQVKNAFTDFYSQHYETIDLNPSLARAFSNKLKEISNDPTR